MHGLKRSKGWASLIRWAGNARLTVGLLAFAAVGSAVGAGAGDQTPVVAPAVAPKNAALTNALVVGIQKPSTRLELLQNIKLLLDQHLSQKDEFYTPDNFEQFFGGSKAQWEWVSQPMTVFKDAKPYKYVYHNTGGLMPPSVLDPKGMDTITRKKAWSGVSVIEGNRYVFESDIFVDGSYSLSASMYFRDGEYVNYADVEKIFGSGWVPAHNPIWHRFYPPRDRPKEEKTLCKITESLGIKQRVHMTFNFNGSLVQINFTERNNGYPGSC